MSVARSLDTRERILAGARHALALHGIGKLAMADVAEAAGVSRATVYRHFPSFAALLSELYGIEAEAFREHFLTLARQASDPAERLQLVIEYATRHVQQHPILQRIVQVDPARALGAIRAQYPTIRKQLGELLQPILAESPAVRDGHVGALPLADAFTRFLVSTYLFPGPDPQQLEASFHALTSLLRVGAPAPKEPA